MKSSSSSFAQIKILSKRADSASGQSGNRDDVPESPADIPRSSLPEINASSELKAEKHARCFRLIEDREWNIVSSEPQSESDFFTRGHSAMSIVSVLGGMGVGKSSLMNKLAGREVFVTHNTGDSNLDTRHTTRGIDVFSTYHSILLDCQPMLAASILDDFLKGRSKSQFSKDILISDPLTSCHMISLQLATFLIATSDYVIIMLRTLVDVHLLKLIASAIMLIGEDNLRAKFIIFSRDDFIHEIKFKTLIDKCLGADRVKKYISNEAELYASVAPYSLKKFDTYQEDPSTFTGKNWLSSCQRLWNSTIKGSSMFADYAMQVYKSHNDMIA